MSYKCKQREYTLEHTKLSNTVKITLPDPADKEPAIKFEFEAHLIVPKRRCGAVFTMPEEKTQ